MEQKKAKFREGKKKKEKPNSKIIKKSGRSSSSSIGRDDGGVGLEFHGEQ